MEKTTEEESPRYIVRDNGRGDREMAAVTGRSWHRDILDRDCILFSWIPAQPPYQFEVKVKGKN